MFSRIVILTSDTLWPHGLKWIPVTFVGNIFWLCLEHKEEWEKRGFGNKILLFNIATHIASEASLHFVTMSNQMAFQRYSLTIQVPSCQHPVLGSQGGKWEWRVAIRKRITKSRNLVLFIVFAICNCNKLFISFTGCNKKNRHLFSFTYISVLISASGILNCLLF